MERPSPVPFFGFSLTWHAFVLFLVLLLPFPWPVLSLPALALIFLYALGLQGALQWLPLLLALRWHRLGYTLSLILTSGFLLVCLINAQVYRYLALHLDDEIVLEHLSHPKTWGAINLSWWHLVIVALLSLAVVCNAWWVLRWNRPFPPAPPSPQPTQTTTIQPRNRRAIGGMLLLPLSAPLFFLFPSPSFEKHLFLYATFATQFPHSQGQDTQQRLRSREAKLRYPLLPLPPPPQKPLHKPHILMILGDTLRQDMLNPQDMPFMTDLSKKMPTLQADFSYSGSHLTLEACFTLFYSLFGYHRIHFLQSPHPPQTLLLLKRLGYRLVALQSSSFDSRNLPGLRKAFDVIEELGGGGLVPMEQRLTQRAIKLFKEHRKQPNAPPLFVLLFYFSPHFPYPFPPEHALHKPYINSLHIDYKTAKKLPLWNRYRNSVRFLDHELKKLFGALAPERKSRSLAWVLLGDHGEEFWEHGQFGHFDRQTTGMRTRSAFALHFPTMKKSQRVHLAHHVDIFPTLFSLIGWDLPYAYFSDGTPLLHKRPRSFVHVNTYHFPRYRPFTLVTDRHQWLLRRDRSFHLHLDAVLDLFDQPLTEVPKQEFAKLIQEWKQEVSRFYPKDTTFTRSQAHITPQPTPFLRPLPNQRHPSATPWP